MTGPSASVAVVICNHNGAGMLGRSVGALARQTRRADRVIVVDNGSTDDSIRELRDRREPVETIELGRNVGFAAASNLGVHAAEGCEWVVLLNSDAFPEPGWLEALLAPSIESGVAAIGSRMLSARDPLRLDGAGDAYHVSGLAWRRFHGWPVSEAPASLRSREVFSVCAAAAAYRRDAFLEVGGLDEDYFCYFEDVDLAFRLRLAGHRCWYAADAVVHHVGSASAVGDFAIYHGHRNLVTTYVKDMPWPLVALHAPQHLLLNVAALAWFSARGHGRAIWRAKRDALIALPRTLGKRRRVQAAASVRSPDLRGLMNRGLRSHRVELEAHRLLRAPRRAAGT